MRLGGVAPLRHGHVVPFVEMRELEGSDGVRGFVVLRVHLEPPVVTRGGGPHPDRPLVQVRCGDEGEVVSPRRQLLHLGVADVVDEELPRVAILVIEEIGDGGAGVVDVEVLVPQQPVRQVVANLAVVVPGSTWVLLRESPENLVGDSVELAMPGRIDVLQFEFRILRQTVLKPVQPLGIHVALLLGEQHSLLELRVELVILVHAPT
mmetsp:Transcript_72276/g.165598  ORF Transcript_72276/g.165598 Transcript_72276/m.165598 type:complete len:207 (+) Transcript_72276:114-734(+)